MATQHALLVFIFLTWALAHAFLVPKVPFRVQHGDRPSTHFDSGVLTRRSTTTTTSLNAFKLTPQQATRRRELLSRSGNFFQLDSFRGKVEFGATADLVTALNPTRPNLEAVKEWLSDERQVALSIWDEKLIKEKGNQIFQLQLITMQFVTIQLNPSVDVKMWTDVDANGLPIFQLQSVAFDPKIQLLPGVGVSAESLGIKIEVAGYLRPTPDGKSVQGKITFVTSGNLPPPMRVLPPPILKGASDTINNTITKFAIDSFRRGAIKQYREFMVKRQQRQEPAAASGVAAK